MLLGFYILIRVLCKLLPEDKFLFIHRWRKSYEYSTVFRTLIESYLNLAFCCTLNIWLLDASSFSRKVSLAAACIAAYLVGGFLVVCLKLSETNDEEMEQDEFKEVYGTIIEDLDYAGSLPGKAYYPIYLTRRLLYVFILVMLIDYPVIQLGLVLALVVIPMLFYLTVYRPFNDIRNNVMNIYNEFIFGLAFLTTLLTNVNVISSTYVETCGWLVIGLIMISLLATWVMVLPVAIRDLLRVVFGLFGEKEATIVIQTDDKKTIGEEKKEGTKLEEAKEPDLSKVAKIKCRTSRTIKRGKLTTRKHLAYVFPVSIDIKLAEEANNG